MNNLRAAYCDVCATFAVLPRKLRRTRIWSVSTQAFEHESSRFRVSGICQEKTLASNLLAFEYPEYARRRLWHRIFLIIPRKLRRTRITRLTSRANVHESRRFALRVSLTSRAEPMSMNQDASRYTYHSPHEPSQCPRIKTLRVTRIRINRSTSL